MNTDKQPVAPVEGHYALLRNGMVVRHMVDMWDGHRGTKTDKDYWTAHPDTDFSDLCWHEDGKSHDDSQYDIIATISPEAMALVANGGLEALEAELGQCNQDNGDWTYENQLLKAKVAELTALADAVCDYADANCRAFPIETAPNDRAIETWDSVGLYWLPVVLHDENFPDADFTHWRETLPPPSNPPLPAVFSDLGAALERLKIVVSLVQIQKELPFQQISRCNFTRAGTHNTL